MYDDEWLDDEEAATSLASLCVLTKALGTLARNKVKVHEVRAWVMLLHETLWSLRVASVMQVVAEMCEQWWWWGGEEALGPALVEYRLRVIGEDGASTADVDALFRCQSALAGLAESMMGREEDLRTLLRQCAGNSVFWLDEDRGREMLEHMESIVGAGAVLTDEEQEGVMRWARAEMEADEDLREVEEEMVAANAAVGGENGTMVMDDASDVIVLEATRTGVRFADTVMTREYVVCDMAVGVDGWEALRGEKRRWLHGKTRLRRTRARTA